VDDANGNGVGFVSDIIEILSSNDGSCISTQATTTTQRQFTVESTLSQCQPFDVSYNPSTNNAPSVRVLIPSGPSFILNQTQADSTAITVPPFQIASYEMTVPRGNQVVLLFNDSIGLRESSNLTTVGGDVTSNTSCLSTFDALTSTVSSTSKSGLSSKVIIGIAASIGSVVVAVAILTGVYAYYKRRLYRWSGAGDSEGDRLNVPGPGPPPFSDKAGESLPTKPVYMNNPYPVGKFTTSPLSPYFVQSPPPTGQNPKFESYELNEKSGPGYPVTIRPAFLSATPIKPRLSYLPSTPMKGATMRQSTASTVDIDHILDLATMYSPARDSRDSKLLTPDSPHSPYSPAANAIVVRSNSGSTTHRDKPIGAFPVSPLPSATNFENSLTVPEPHPQSQVIGPDEQIVERVRDMRTSSGSYAGNSAFRFPALPEPAVTNGYSGAGVGLGRGLSEGDQ
jgi:hypothetical protein